MTISLEAGYLHTLTVAARVDKMSCNPEIQAALEVSINRLHSDLRVILGPLEADVQSVLEARDKIWHQILDLENQRDSIWNRDATEWLLQPEQKDSLREGEKEEEIEIGWRLELVRLKLG